MLTKYRALVASLPHSDVLVASEKLGLQATDGAQLFVLLQRRGLGQADLVLSLLRAGRHRAVELLIGKPIEVLAPARHPVDLQLAALRPRAEGRRIRLLAAHNPLTSPSARARWELLRRCSTLESYATRVPRWKAVRDVREWSAAGWLEVAS